MKWNLILPAIEEIPLIRGAGAPTGTPPFNGARYLDTLTGVIYLGRNVLNFNASAFITLPTIAGVRNVECQFWHNDATPPANRFLFDVGTFVSDTDRMYTQRVQTTGVLSFNLVGSTATLNGSTINSDATNPATNTWNRFSLPSANDRSLGKIGARHSNTFQWAGRIVNLVARGASNNILANYAIDEGSGTTIIDSSGNGRNGTLTLGSGSWELTWVPQN